MGKKAVVKYRSLRSNLVHLPLSLYAQLVQQQARPQSLILHLSPLATTSSSSSGSAKHSKPAYVGWSGLSAAHSGQPGELENIEVDPEVSLAYGWKEGTMLEISIIHHPTKALSISVTPQSTDDWEILEQHTSFLENHLLGQLRAAVRGQEIDVWVLGRTKIRIRVDETNPDSGSSAVLITPDTEIYVAPRPRSSTTQPMAEKTHVISSTAQVNGDIKGKGKGKQQELELRFVPPRIAGTWGQPGLPPDVMGGGARTIALCSGSTFLACVRRFGISEVTASIAVVVAAPMEKASNIPVLDEQETVEGNKGEAKAGAEKVFEASLIIWDDMPDDHVALLGHSEDLMDDWGIITISPNMKPRAKPKKGKPPSPFTFPHPQSSRALPGTSTLIDQATSYFCRAAQTDHSRPLLLVGAKGSGKTSVARAIAAELESDREMLTEMLYEDVSRIDPDSRLATLKETMRGWIENAQKRVPCLLVLDGLDTLLAPESELSSSGNPAILADLFCRLLAPSSIPQGVLVLVTANSNTSLHPTLNTKHMFGETVKIPPLTKEIRQELLRLLVEAPKDVRVNGATNESELDYVELGGLTEGYSTADLSDLVDGARQQALIRSVQEEPTKLDLTMIDFEVAQGAFTPLNLRGVSLQKSQIKWGDIGGLVEPKRVLRETLEWPTKYAQIFANCPLRLRSGLLLYGFPGCGKTLLASAVAKECGLNFISVKGPEILNKYIGASEKAVRDLFERASGAKPCVLFFDEFDSIAPKRGHDSTGVTDRVVNQLLTEMDGAQGLSGVYVLGATSRPDLIDPALLRPGRLDKSILCPMPTFSDRLDILQATSKKLEMGDDVDLGMVADATEGYSGADLQAVVYNAHLEVVHSSLAPPPSNTGEKQGKGKGKEGKEKNSLEDSEEAGEKRVVYTQINPDQQDMSAAAKAEVAKRIETVLRNTVPRNDDGTAGAGQTAMIKPKMVISQAGLMRAVEATRPSVSPADRKRLESIYRNFVSARDGQMGDGDLGRGTGTRTSLM